MGILKPSEIGENTSGKRKIAEGVGEKVFQTLDGANYAKADFIREKEEEILNNLPLLFDYEVKKSYDFSDGYKVNSALIYFSNGTSFDLFSYEKEDGKLGWYYLFLHIVENNLKIKSLDYNITFSEGKPLDIKLNFSDKRVKQALMDLVLNKIEYYQNELNEEIEWRKENDPENIPNNLTATPTSFYEACRYLIKVAERASGLE